MHMVVHEHLVVVQCGRPSAADEKRNGDDQQAHTWKCQVGRHVKKGEVSEVGQKENREHYQLNAPSLKIGTVRFIMTLFREGAEFEFGCEKHKMEQE